MRSINLQMDGNQVCATWDNFDCFITSPAGFGNIISEAVTDLIAHSGAIEINGIVSSIENAPQIAICPSCNGTGEMQSGLLVDIGKPCVKCGGSGKQKASA